MFHKLNNNGNSYDINSRRPFEVNTELSGEDIQKCFDFAYDMTFGSAGEHRNHRSGGQVRRKNGEIFIDTFQGKLAEFAFYNYFKNQVQSLTSPDLSVMGLSKWDGGDFCLNGKEIAIKSTKYFGNLLLLETKDWTSEGIYKPNIGSDGDKYDFFVLIRIKPDGTAIMKSNRFLYSMELEKNTLKNAIMNEKWECNIVGYVTLDEIVEIINNDFILPQNSMLNGKTRMDAENYYVQAGDMHNISELLSKV